jgi:hypothetical protein
MTSPSGESRGGTPVGERIPKGMRAAFDDAVVVEQRFPAFRFLFSFRPCRSFFVITGLDPVIHAEKRLGLSTG